MRAYSGVLSPRERLIQISDVLGTTAEYCTFLIWHIVPAVPNQRHNRSRYYRQNRSPMPNSCISDKLTAQSFSFHMSKDSVEKTSSEISRGHKYYYTKYLNNWWNNEVKIIFRCDANRYNY